MNQNKLAKQSCQKCTMPDDSRMVQCDHCDKWSHYKCVNVSDEVANVSWMCEDCNSTLTPTATSTVIAQSSTPTCVASNAKSATAAQMMFELNTALNNTQLPQNPTVLTTNQTSACATENMHAYYVNSSQQMHHMRNQQPIANMCNCQYCSNVYMPHVMHNQGTFNGIGHNNQTVNCITSSIAACQISEQQPMQNTAYNFPNFTAPNEVLQHPYSYLQQMGPTNAQLAARHAIPKDLPHFSGDPEEWPLFISSFETSTSIAGYSNAENLVRLQACLRGKAREMVRCKLLLPAMVPEVIQTLRMCFGRPEFILEGLIEKVRKVPPVKDKLEALIDLALGVRNICATIESCHMEVYYHNPMLVKEILEKIPNQL